MNYLKLSWCVKKNLKQMSLCLFCSFRDKFAELSCHRIGTILIRRQCPHTDIVPVVRLFFPITSLSHTHKLYYLHTTHRLLTLQQANCLSWVFSFCEHHWSPEQLCPVPAAHWFGHGHKTPHIYPSPEKEQDFLNRCFPRFHFPKQYSI